MILDVLLSATLSIGMTLILMSTVLRILSIRRERRNRLLSRYAQSNPNHVRAGNAIQTDRIVLRRDVQIAAWNEASSLKDAARHLITWYVGHIKREALMIVPAVFLIWLGLAWVLQFNPVFAFLIAGIAVVGARVVLHQHLRKRRLTLISEKVPEALDVIIRSLKVGSPINNALRMVGTAIDGPIGEEFATTAQEISYGHDLTVALQELAYRCENQDIHFFATVVEIHNNSGGNLVDVLTRLTIICRNRQKLKRKIATITSEARWSGRFLSAFPIFAAVMLFLIQPDYFAEVSQADFFRPMLALIAFLLLSNILFMQRMIRLQA
ncbi:type II secretion system F family protein [Roseovarius sp. MS2]|uniref:type II secretion system F family protein n=1 Tax=Roseovarius sp. MS2 TaxID=3390728 RepID=UPI003EDC9C54